MSLTRQVNHINRHKTQHPKTLMRRSVSRPDIMASGRLKAQAISSESLVAIKPAESANAPAARYNRATSTQRSQYVSHFVSPLGSSFTPSHIQPIKSVVNKPKVETDLTIDELLLKAVDNIEDQLLNLEQRPIRRLHRFTRSLVANRFNGIALN